MEAMENADAFGCFANVRSDVAELDDTVGVSHSLAQKKERK